MERHIDEELKKFRTDLLTMAALVEESIHSAILALKTQDIELAKKIINDDKNIDEWEIAIEEHSVELLALFQPLAKDLRFLTVGMQINTELERIADLVVNICQRVIELNEVPLLKPLIDIPKLADVAKSMVRNSIDAFISSNEEQAKQVIMTDIQANKLRNAIVHELINEYMVKDGTTAPRAVPLLLIARDLERICDHSKAIAEDVLYMINAVIVRHHKERLRDSK
jgi:phosphate transport system protein